MLGNLTGQNPEYMYSFLDLYSEPAVGTQNKIMESVKFRRFLIIERGAYYDNIPW